MDLTKKRVAKNVFQLIGETPLLQLNQRFWDLELSKSHAQIFAKLEYLNPAGSIKDRAAAFMILDAEKRGLLRPGSVIIEPTSGNTGIGLAACGASRGYKVILTMPETMSKERRDLLKAYGAQLVLTSGSLGMKGAIQEAERLVSQIENSFMPMQFDNPANPSAHYETTGPEIFDALNGHIDFFVAGVGTGGTLSGAGSFLKQNISNIKIIAVEPSDSPVISQGKPGAHALQGIGAGFIPKNLDVGLLDEVIQVTKQQAFEMSRRTAKTQGILIGISSGAALYAAVQLAKRPQNKDKTIAVVFPDSGERYMSTGLFED